MTVQLYFTKLQGRQMPHLKKMTDEIALMENVGLWELGRIPEDHIRPRQLAR